MTAWRYEISLLVLKNIFQHSKRNILYELLDYLYQQWFDCQDHIKVVAPGPNTVDAHLHLTFLYQMNVLYFDGYNLPSDFQYRALLC